MLLNHENDVWFPVWLTIQRQNGKLEWLDLYWGGNGLKRTHQMCEKYKLHHCVCNSLVNSPRFCTGSDQKGKNYEITPILNKITTLENEQRKNSSSNDCPALRQTGARRGSHIILSQSTMTCRYSITRPTQLQNDIIIAILKIGLHIQIKNSIRSCGTVRQALNIALIIEARLLRRNRRPRPPAKPPLRISTGRFLFTT